MAETTIQEQIVRESPEIEAYKLGLLQLAKQRAETPVSIPSMQAAELTPQQTLALQLAGAGIGSYAPYMESAGQAFTKAAEGYGGLPQYGQAGIQAVNQATQTAGGMYGQLPSYGEAGMQAVNAATQTAGGMYGQLPSYGQAAMETAGGYGGLATSLGAAGTQAYDPNMAMAYMNPYQGAVTQKAIEEMSRQAQIQQQGLSAQAVKSGAFGGSREGVQRAELGRNLADIQSKRVLEDYFANYSQAQTAALNAFQNQQARTQAAGNVALGAGQLGLSGITQGGQLQQAGAAGIANLGQLGLQGATQAGQLQQAGAAGIANLGQLGLQAATQGGQLQQASAAGIGTLGQQTAALGQLQSGLQQGDVSFLYNIGSQQQQQRQKELDAARQTSLQTAYEPFQRISFLSDIYKGAPSSQQTISQSTAPSPSLVSQVAGLGTAGLAAYNLSK
jgi:hypothetical protein